MSLSLYIYIYICVYIYIYVYVMRVSREDKPICSFEFASRGPKGNFKAGPAAIEMPGLRQFCRPSAGRPCRFPGSI